MRSLRARLLAGVLLLTAVGLIALAGVTYAEQRNFLQSRLNQEVKNAAPGLAQALQEQEPRENGQNSGKDHDSSGGHAPGGDGGQHGAPPAVPPDGTYGARLSESGEVIIARRFEYGESSRPDPRLPKHPPIEKLFNVDSYGSSGLEYRVYVTPDADDHELTVAAIPLESLDQTLENLLIVEGLLIAGVLSAIAVSGYFIVRLGLRPLDRIEETAEQIAAGDLSHRVSPATPRTEVGRLGIALNAMLDRLESAFREREASESRLRRFLADASHELRTPLASIRGYAELFRMGAAAGEQDTRTAMRRIEEESKRMGSLVENLLTLARLDEEPTPLRTEVELVDLARDAVTDANAMAPERSIELHAPESAVVLGDAHQLRQVLANLMRNALVHTPAGTPVELGVADEAGAVLVTVRDHGPGLPASADGSVFERFWRAEVGRSRGPGGAGLGLSIVHAIVASHGGEIFAENAPGEGALFTVRLPRAERAAATGAAPARR